MFSSEQICLFCKTDILEGFSIFGEIGCMEHAVEIIEAHFWFDTTSPDFQYHHVCYDCWEKVKSFHVFYQMVEEVYSTNLIDDNECLVDDETEPLDLSNAISIEYSNVYERVIGLEIQYMEDESACEENTELDESHHDETEAEIDTEIKNTTSKDNVDSNQEIENILTQSEPVETREKVYGKRKRKSTIKLEPKQKSNRAQKHMKRQIEHIECYVCRKPMKEFKYLRRHLFTHEPKDSFQFQCKICEKKFSHGNILEKHIKRSHGSKTPIVKPDINCPICYIQLKPASLKPHMLRVHEKKPITKTCNICAKVFQSQSNLSQHLAIHMDRKLTEVQCKICGKWVKNRHILRSHNLTHKTQKPEKCPHCNKVKYSIRALRSHIMVAHSEPKHQCTYCDKSFTRPVALKEHIAIHTGESLHNCLYCARSFKNSANMYKHMREMHTEWKVDRAKKA